MSDPRASLTGPPRGHIKADTTPALTHYVWARARSTETCLFSLLEPWKAVFLYRPTHIYWNNKPQSPTCTRLPQLTVIFMFTPLKLRPQRVRCQLAKMDQLHGMRKDRSEFFKEKSQIASNQLPGLTRSGYTHDSIFPRQNVRVCGEIQTSYQGLFW